jgi:peptide/nickel transport system substrate-binding protein
MFFVLFRNVIAVLILIIALINIQCHRNQDHSAEEISFLSILWPDFSGLFNPCLYLNTRMLLFDSLLDNDENGNFVGRLAQSWEFSSDFRTWKIKLHENAKWHDGMPVTSYDIEFTFHLLSHPKVGLLPPNSVTMNVINEKEYTIVFHGNRNYSPFNTTSIYFPKHLLENLNPDDFCQWPFWNEPIGSGPYRFVRRIPKTFVELEANPDYYLGEPKIDRLRLKYGESALTGLLSGNVEVAMYVSEMDVLKLHKDPRFESYYFLGNPVAIFWNHNNAKFSDSNVRKALTLAINRKELFALLNLPGESLAFDIPCTKRQYIKGEISTALSYDPQQARQLLESAGWIDENGDGVREKDGLDFQFTAITGSSHKSAVYVQDQLRRVGIRMEILALNNYNVQLRFREGDFEAIFYVFKPIIGGKSFGDDYPPMGYKNPQVVSLFSCALDTWSDDKGEDLLKELWPIFERDIPVTFLYYNVWTNVAHKRLKGLRSLQRADPILEIEHLWIENE